VATRRLELGFEGGTVLRLTVDEAVGDEFTTALSAGAATWRSLQSEEGVFWVNPGELVYVRLPPGEAPGRVGFGDS
jgi:hypothetical protein